MAKIYFKKTNARNTVFSQGKPVKFTPLAENMGVIELDTEADALTIADLQAFVDKKVGGVFASTEQEYLDLKKNMPWVPSKPKSDMILANMGQPLVGRPVAQSTSAQPVTAPANAVVAAAQNPVASAAEPATAAPNVVATAGRGRKIRVGAAKPNASPPAGAV